MSSRDIVTELLSRADITINGERPWDVQVFNDDLFSRILSGGSLALGESYMDGWWSAQELDEFFYRLLRSNVSKEVKNDPHIWFSVLKAKLVNQQRGSRAYNIGNAHYDLGDDLFEVMLDRRRVYSCGYWKNATTLEKAQEDKLDLICRKLGLEKGMRLLDIGCGWGSLAAYAAQTYGAEVVGVTVSQDQYDVASNTTRNLPVEIRYSDYRNINETFDRIVSVGMFEHVGSRNYREYMEVVDRNLRDGGSHLVHTIGRDRSSKPGEADPWIGKYIFPAGQLPSMTQIARSAEGLFTVEDVHNFGPYYDQTIMAWKQNFENAWPSLRENYDDRFKRMWEYYLASCAGAFRARRLHLWQVVFSKHPDGIYPRVS